MLFQKPKCGFSYLFAGFLPWSFEQGFFTFPDYIFYGSSQSLRRKFSSPTSSQISHCCHPLLQLIHPSQSFSRLGRTGWSVSLCQSALVPKQIKTLVGSLRALKKLFLQIPCVCKEVCTERSLTMKSLEFSGYQNILSPVRVRIKTFRSLHHLFLLLQQQNQDFIQRITSLINWEDSPATTKSKPLVEGGSWAGSAPRLWAPLGCGSVTHFHTPSSFLLSALPHSVAGLNPCN